MHDVSQDTFQFSVSKKYSNFNDEAQLDSIFRNEEASKILNENEHSLM